MRLYQASNVLGDAYVCLSLLCFCDFLIIVLNCSDSVVFYVLHRIITCLILIIGLHATNVVGL